MTSKNTLIIGTRGSALALAQADMVRAALSLRYPELDVRCEIIHTIGDRRTDVPLADVARVSGMVDKGIFIKELETALRDGRIDVAVHSLKDVPSELAAGFTLAAVLPRAAVEDVLITKEPDWNGSGTLATGSVRRRLMARTYWGSGLRFENLRGNVPTRLGKLVEHPGWDAVILARAGLERLGLYAPETLVEGRKLYMRPLPVEVFIPAVGQGIVGMECRSSDRETAEMLEGINDPESFACALAERAFLVRLGANCYTPVGVYAHPDGEELVLRAAYYVPGREEPFAVVIRGDRKAPEALGLRAFEELGLSGWRKTSSCSGCGEK
ncbi:hydroxymethylbilane synthase [Akkermansia muciniphila]|jgi:hydroxymethylbilane synthase|uniref:hydroxymethylbilane synthase n=1 Tax=Akkermansia muciniphila TaxID=239935 RepID=UPI00080C4489|nr:hydroxymethylbilane synthase [Akkermansia muciniphila]QQR32254.1 hydroxymethylbilane synthase [Akkermansia muciniphila]